MGFGIKTDFKTGREIDLDKTYRTIIKPVFENLGFLCYRADDIKHSGVIDIPMYENILKADFVLADISTLNPNVLYELGIRHAVRKSTTLIIAEKELTYPFDLNHILIDSYEHLGSAIDYEEVIRFQKHLSEKVSYLMEHPAIDSPLYSLLPNLQTPTFTKVEIDEIKENIEEEKSASDIVEEAEKARKNGEFEKAIALYTEAQRVLPRNDYIVQRLSLVTYKSKIPDEGKALRNAESILSALFPERTTDPETLGLSGAINKRLYEVYARKDYLEKAIWFYNRGYYIKQDYYNGINAAFLYSIKSVIDEDKFMSFANYGQARNIRKEIIEICLGLISSDSFKKREDKDWIYLSLAEAYFGLEDFESEMKYFELAKSVTEGDFSINSYSEQKSKLKSLSDDFKTKWKLDNIRY